MNILTMQRDLNDKLPAYAWPGGYTIYYLTPQGESLCPDCATEELDSWCDADWRGPSYPWTRSPNYTAYNGPQYAEIHYEETEDANLYCAQCDKHIEAAYAD